VEVVRAGAHEVLGAPRIERVLAEHHETGLALGFGVESSNIRMRSSL
jgi:hypothetical protein